ncbi:hypothetical protein N7499_006310 [Penicillium canescens]|uniref:Uncharacterized protein n=1 Tax=Penicillium canescens TaxID=5083 RepID=A0AAD6NBV4_PENCN|nr:uncharacterized protein N7446_005594 [Penicillium canescens]KAJ6050165.1 hypothetical protein N7444_006881 [Penicillium canescens]KAJ6050966.1 hypothetical protein N7460_001500 [Penicillium canescens]KAJ6061474.1 hypothetical protein N7446_005594 [Penicillium canescens]KAJ6081436.1 hypothetical protein N7499_006310 [Penicillium canescens]KAJ6176768.1 hypothetical protein N7485_003682 [Penicillium canescens]
MEISELNSKLKEVFDMAVFSQLLEMDEEKDRKISSTALYSFIEKGEQQVDVMEYYLESLQQCAAAMGFYKVHESCGNIRRASAMINRHSQVAETAQVDFLRFIKKEIGTLSDTVLYARATIDLFYEAN